MNLLPNKKLHGNRGKSRDLIYKKASGYVKKCKKKVMNFSKANTAVMWA